MDLIALREQNPWWVGKEAINKDRHLVLLKEMSFLRKMSIVDKLNFNNANLYTLRGPRQVGKTTLSKILIKRLLEKDVPPGAVVYLSLDLVKDYQEIVKVVRLAKSFMPKAGRHYFFIDEISSVEHWQKAIKYLRDSLAAGDFFFLTGSSSRDIRKGAERLPGRRGNRMGLDKILMPLSFREFAKIRLPSAFFQEEKTLSLEEIKDSSADSLLKEGLIFLPELESALSEYALVGGFPQAVDAFLKAGKVAPVVLQTLWDALAGDIERWGRERIMALKLMERAQASLGSALSWHSLAEAAGFASPITAQEYVEILSDEFILLVLHFFDLSKMKIAPKKGKKIYFTDPLLFQLYEHVSLGRGMSWPIDDIKMSCLVENMAACGLFSSVEKERIEIFSMPQREFYWKSSAQKEVDFLIRLEKDIVPVEVKYQRAIRKQDLLTIRNSFGKGIVLSKDILDLTSAIKIIPVALFLWFLAEN